MSAEPYSEIGDDESGIVPTQGARSPDWPKKIRTLTAAELDRLTIDGAGRFYWDGRLVNYEPPRSEDDSQHASSDDSDGSISERPTYDPNDHHPPDIDGAELPHRYEARTPRDDTGAVDLDSVSARGSDTAPGTQMARLQSPEGAVMMAPAIQIPDRVRIKLSRWQSLGAIIVTLAVVAGASGMAAYGLVAAHDWGCRVGLVERYCPAVPTTQPPGRRDIPA